MKKQHINIESIILTGTQVALFSLVINFISGGLFKSREKMYRKKGFSNQKSKAQAYANARVGQVLTMLM